MIRNCKLSFLLLITTSTLLCQILPCSVVQGFVSIASQQQQQRRRLLQTGRVCSEGGNLKLQKGWFVPDEDEKGSGSGSGGGSNDFDDDEQSTLVTREMLLRDLIADPQVKRKNKNKQGYKPLDNRDHLPYVVKQITPDPYTKQEIKKAKQVQSKNKRTDLELIGSRLSVKAANDVSTVLGEFQLDKSTTSGDIICIADRTYKVETARCQYKYAGGQRFVMVRKILEVKEITRAIQEAQLQKQLALTTGMESNSEKTSGPD